MVIRRSSVLRWGRSLTYLPFVFGQRIVFQATETVLKITGTWIKEKTKTIRSQVSNERVYKLAHAKVLVATVIQRQLKLQGHILRMDKYMSPYMSSVKEWGILVLIQDPINRIGNRINRIGKRINPNIPPTAEEIFVTDQDRSRWREMPFTQSAIDRWWWPCYQVQLSLLVLSGHPSWRLS